MFLYLSTVQFSTRYILYLAIIKEIIHIQQCEVLALHMSHTR